MQYININYLKSLPEGSQFFLISIVLPNYLYKLFIEIVHQYKPVLKLGFYAAGTFLIGNNFLAVNRCGSRLLDSRPHIRI